MEKLRLGVIGVGSVVREIYQYLYFTSEYSDFIEVVAIADPLDDVLGDFGATHNIPAARRFADHESLLDAVELDAVMVNTPDSMHAEPTVAALERGIDVLVPKPTAATVADAHRMRQAALDSGRLLAVDYHKRDDPRTKEAATRYRSGEYGPLQSTVWYMIDKLLVADPNHVPRFFASPDFAEKNTPVSFLTVHIADTLLYITGLRPVSVRAVGYKQKLPSLSPISVDGYDLVDSVVMLDSGAVAHFISGWHLPNSLWSYSTQWSRLVCREAMVDLQMDICGYHEVIDDGIFERNALFLNFEPNGLVTGFGMSNPGKLLRRFREFRTGALDGGEREAMLTPEALGFYTTLITEGIHRSLADGSQSDDGVVNGVDVDLRELLVEQLGETVAAEYL